MIKALESIDRTTAAGLLARAALSLGYAANPSTRLTEDENELVVRIIDEARGRLGLSVDDQRPEAYEQIADLLDEESEKLLAPPDTQAALRRLAERGDLPSDLYEIQIVDNVVDLYGKQFPLEKQIIETTIRAPSLEQHYGAGKTPNEPGLISVFARSFRTKWPLKDFIELVAGQRDGFKLYIHQAWRIYPRFVDLAGAAKPVDMIRRFADTYGSEIEVEGKRASFFLMAQGPIPKLVQVPARPHTTIMSRFQQYDPKTGVEFSTLIVSINADKYMKTLDAMSVRREDILDSFVPAPRPRD
jgi:hypothetical protein